MTSTLPIPKTYKLFIGGAFPRSESGRSLPVLDARGRAVAHLCRASRKDLREAVEAARNALPKWSGMTVYNRGQILYRMAEMLDGRRAEFIEAIKVAGVVAGAGAAAPSSSAARANRRTRGGAPAGGPSRLPPATEVAACVDRLVAFAGWSDKHAEVLGHRAAVAGPYHVFSLPEPTGVVAIVAPDAPPLLGLVTLTAAAICCGNTAVCIASEANPIPAAVLGEVLATSDVPGGAVNILTGTRDELVPFVALHREIRAVSAADLPTEQATQLRAGAAENLKRVHVAPRGEPARWLDDEAETSIEAVAPFVEIKTIWHPSGA
ncbi:MAG: aldehyde dehydrogenase family protein [Phycisphaerales bacterium]